MITYNGKPLKEIVKNLPKNMYNVHKRMYLQNCIAIFKLGQHNYNSHEEILLRRENFILINTYLTTNGI